MALPGSAILALAVLCTSPTCPLGCPLPPRSASLEAFTLLSQMERLSVSSCLTHRAGFRVPQLLVEDGSRFEDTQAIAVTHEVLQQIFSLFSRSGSQTAWEDGLLDPFLMGIDQQLSDLQMCVGQDTQANKNSRLAVKRYFHDMSLYLKKRGYSPCAWEVLRVEIRRCLFFVNNLTERFRK